MSDEVRKLDRDDANYYRDVVNVNVRLALEGLVEAIRWRANSTNSDGEDLGPDEHEAFDRAESALAAAREHLNGSLLAGTRFDTSIARSMGK